MIEEQQVFVDWLCDNDAWDNFVDNCGGELVTYEYLDNHLEDRGSLYCCLVSAFRWVDSPEGWNYWEELDGRMEEEIVW